MRDGKVRHHVMSDAEMNRLALRVKETAQRLGISTGKVYFMLETGELPGIRCGRAWLVPVKALEDWLAEAGR